MGGLSTYVGESISFLENIYDEVDLVKMEIGNFDFFRGRKRGNGKFSRTWAT